MKDLPVILMFYCFPLISIAARFLGKGQLNYDYFWAPAFFVALGNPPLERKAMLE